MQRARLIAEKNAEIDVLSGLNLTEVTPSRRDFAMFVATQKSGITLIPRLKRADADTAGAWPGLDFVALARVLDDTEIGALSVATAGYYGASIGDLQSVAEAVTAPVLRDDICLHRLQVFQARLHGADAVLLPLRQIPAPRQAEVIETASSTHMASVIEVGAPDEIDAALAFGKACIGIQCQQADGYANMAKVRELAERIPRTRTVILLSEVTTLEAVWSLSGLIDAAVVGDMLLNAPDAAAFVEAWQRRNG